MENKTIIIGVVAVVVVLLIFNSGITGITGEAIKVFNNNVLIKGNLTVTNNVKVNSFVGKGYGYVCVNNQGKLFRSLDPCVSYDSLDYLVLAINDDSPPSDTVLLAKMREFLAKEGYDDIPYSKMFSQINALNLDKKLTLAIDKNEAVVIVGATSPPRHTIVAADVMEGLDTLEIKRRYAITSDQIKTKNLADLFPLMDTK